MKDRTNQIISILLKLIIVVCATIGLVLCFFSSGFMGGKTLFLYFTIQSNIWIAVVDLIIAFIMINSLRTGEYALNDKLYLIQQIFTVSITLTGFVFCFVLIPSFMAMGAYASGFNLFAPSQTLLHVVVPVLAVIDLIGFTRHANFTKMQCLWATIPPLYYLGFATIGYFKNWNFGGGNNFPYFFLNYDSPAGLFGFSNITPYYLGSFYWIILLLFFVLGISLIYIVMVNKFSKNYKERYI